MAKMKTIRRVEPLVDELARMLSDRQTIPLSYAQRFLSMLDSAPDDALRLIVKAKIPFLWMPAASRLRERGKVK